MEKKKSFIKTPCGRDIEIVPATNPDGSRYWLLTEGCSIVSIEANTPLMGLHVHCAPCTPAKWQAKRIPVVTAPAIVPASAAIAPAPAPAPASASLPMPVTTPISGSQGAPFAMPLTAPIANIVLPGPTPTALPIQAQSNTQMAQVPVQSVAQMPTPAPMPMTMPMPMPLQMPTQIPTQMPSQSIAQPLQQSMPMALPVLPGLPGLPLPMATPALSHQIGFSMGTAYTTAPVPLQIPQAQAQNAISVQGQAPITVGAPVPKAGNLQSLLANGLPPELAKLLPGQPAPIAPSTPSAPVVEQSKELVEGTVSEITPVKEVVNTPVATVDNMPKDEAPKAKLTLALQNIRLPLPGLPLQTNTTETNYKADVAKATEAPIEVLAPPSLPTAAPLSLIPIGEILNSVMAHNAESKDVASVVEVNTHSLLEIEPKPLVVTPTQTPVTTYALSTPPTADKLAEFNLLKVVDDAITAEDKIDVDEILCAHIPEMSGGPSSGGFSWHTLEHPMKCWRRAYNALVLGLVQKKPGRQLQWGSLYHACWELWFKTGGRKSWDLPCAIIREAGGVSLAAEVQMAVQKELEIYARTEAEEWDIRAVEANAVCWIEPTRINGKLVQVPISCRHDLIYAKRAAGTPCAPFGPVPGGVYILDRKTATAATRDLIYGYAMDGQFLTNAVVFQRSDEEERFGPLLGVQVAAAIKHKTPSEKSYFRVEATINVAEAATFYKDELVPYATELYRRLSDPAVRGDRNCWPRNHSQCSGKYMCPYFDLCANGEDSLIADIYYKVSERRKFNLDSLALPPKGKAVTEPVIDPVKEAKKERKIEIGNLISAALTASFQNLPQFDKRRFLVPGHTDVSVRTALIAELQVIWPVQHAWLWDLQGLPFKCTVKSDGIGWSVVEPVKEEVDRKKKAKGETYRGALSWKALATLICKDWWDLSKNPPLPE